MHSPQKLIMSSKGGGEPRLFQSYLPSVPTGLAESMGGHRGD